MENESLKKKQIAERSINIFPFYMGFGADLLFFVAIDTLFLSYTKHFTDEQIVSSTAIALIISLILQLFLLRLFDKISTTVSCRIGGAMILSSAILYTIGTDYPILILTKVLYYVGFTFYNLLNVMLKNDLSFLDRENEFVLVKTRGNTIYSVTTMLISFIATPLFNINPYIPMACCIAFSCSVFVMSFIIKDVSSDDYYKDHKPENKQKSKFKYSKLFIIAFAAYGAFFALVNSSQTDGKLFIQGSLGEKLEQNKVALIIGAMLIVSRIIRVFSNIICQKLYMFMKEKLLGWMSGGMLLAIATVLLGSFIGNIIISSIVMCSGYVLFLFIRDPYKVCMQDIMLNRCPKESHKTMLTTMEFWYRAFNTALSLSLSFLISGFGIISVMIGLGVLAAISFLMNLYLIKLANPR